MVPRVLIRESSAELRREIAGIMQFMEYLPVTSLDNARLIEELTGSAPPELIILGDCGEQKALAELYRAVRNADPYIPILLLVDRTKNAGLNGEIESGAIGKIEVPLRYSDVNSALQKVHIYRENRHQEGPLRSLELFRNLVGGSAGVQRLRKMIEKVAGAEANVLITGESGTGKEAVARHIHYHSKRRNKPFVPINCNAIPADLLESELFGHEKGAFAGAILTREGRLEMAEGGTLFLEKIGYMSLPLQVKVLRVMQDRTFERVGSNRSLHSNVRIIAATHVELEDAIASGRFREDLYHRLNVFPIETPPLRTRTEDLPLLVNDLAERLDHEGRGTIRLTPLSFKSLAAYPWPGNLRELANLIERLTILYPNGIIDIQDLPEKYQLPELMNVPPAPQDNEDPIEPLSVPRLPRAGLDLKEHLNNLEYSLIHQALDESNWIVAHAAKRLMMGRTTLVEKMRKFRLRRNEDATGL